MKTPRNNFAVHLGALALAVLTAVPSTPSQAQVVALDNADGYPSPPDHNWPANNGGFGYNLWTPISDTSGGGTYMEGVGVNNRQVEGNYSFALYAGGGAYDISRQLASPITSGQFSIITRFDLAGAGPNLVNLRAGNNTSAFGGGELLSFGIVNGNQLDYTDSAGLHVLPSGEARGSVWDWNVNFNAGTGAYSGSVTNLGGGFAAFFSGTLELSGTNVDSFGVINSSTGNSQNLIFDVPEFQATPEPSSMVLLGLGGVGILLWLRRGKRS